MFYVRCIRCNQECEIPPDAVGENRTDPWNVIYCHKCGLSFDYDDEDVVSDDRPPSTFL